MGDKRKTTLLIGPGVGRGLPRPCYGMLGSPFTASVGTPGGRQLVVFRIAVESRLRTWQVLARVKTTLV